MVLYLGGFVVVVVCFLRLQAGGCQQACPGCGAAPRPTGCSQGAMSMSFLEERQVRSLMQTFSVTDFFFPLPLASGFELFS